MSRFTLPRSLFARNIALLVALVIVSQIGSLSVLMNFVQRPRIERAAETFAIYVQTLDDLLKTAAPDAQIDLAVRFEASRQFPAGAASEPSVTWRNFYRTYQRDVFIDTLREHLPASMPVQWQTGSEQRLWIRAHLGHEPYWIALPVPEAAHNDGMLFTIALSIGLGALAIVTAYLIQRHINRPLRDLADAARGLSAGAAPQTLRIDGPTEIAQVSAAFNQMVHALQEADATRSLMLAGISHDIRTPLTKLRLAVAMTTPSDEHDALAVSTDHYLDQIDAILQQFMDYAGSGTREVTEVTDLNALVSNLAADFAGLGHVFELTLGELQPFAFRPISVMRVLMNLMQNAVLYGRVGLSVRTWADDVIHTAYVEVADRGKGASGSDLDALKAPFKRGRSTGAHPGGTGLGLAIVERIAKLHGGELQLLQREGGGFAAIVSLRTAKGLPSREGHGEA
ncbi:ATP-binding protein [Caballeronia sp. SEWSISQ10-4 2]|uniref:ATP-binding protein n=1 Tax=Caballeronia sp. SEWSISQ10-4 2 TaxID=2937438 RepID=UPI00264EBADB|nr:ATP-binding protein [Caballeronia sp. SEWSISQ10-4 2]MDN7180039.1 ATP-binding protein [Caballeronia sp. SEWSISQ10-4 2]